MFSSNLITSDNSDDLISKWISDIQKDISLATTDITKCHSQGGEDATLVSDQELKDCLVALHRIKNAH